MKPKAQWEFIIELTGNAIECARNPPEQALLEAVKHDPNIIKLINNPSESIQMEAVKRDLWVIQFIKQPAESVQFEAVRQKNIKYTMNYVLSLINEPSQLVLQFCLFTYAEAMGMDVEKLCHRLPPSFTMYHPAFIQFCDPVDYKEAIQCNVWAIQYINDPSESLQLEAVRQNWKSIECIKNPTETVKLEASRLKFQHEQTFAEFSKIRNVTVITPQNY